MGSQLPWGLGDSSGLNGQARFSGDFPLQCGVGSQESQDSGLRTSSPVQEGGAKSGLWFVTLLSSP